MEPALLAVIGGTFLLVLVHFFYWWTERRGFPLFVDESGYIGYAFDHAHALRRGGVSELYESFRTHGVYAQLVPLLTVPFLLVFGESVTASYLAILAFYGAMVVVTYLIARRIVAPWWAALAALVVALVPQMVTFARMYYFAVPVAAWLVLAVWCYLMSEKCDRPAWTIAAGAAMGLAPLSRTMALAFVPGPLIAAGLQALSATTRRTRRLLYLGAGALVGFALAWVWFSRNLSGARKQLEGSYQGQGHGEGNPEFGRGVRELHQFIEVFQVPLILLMTIAVVAAIVFAVLRRRARTHAAAAPDGSEAPVVAAPPSRRSELFHEALGFLTSATGFLLIVVVVGVAGLLVGKEALAQWIPLVPFVVVLVVVALASLPAGTWRTVVVAALIAVSIFNVLSLTDVWSWLGERRRVDAGPIGSLTVTDGRSFLDTIYERRGYPTSRPGHLPDEYEEWPAVYSELDAYMIDYAAAQGEPAIVLSQSDTLLLPNDLILADRLNYDSLRIGVSPLRVGTEYREQLNSNAGGIPNFVLTIEPLEGAPGSEDRERELPKVERALEAEGFEIIRTVELPDGRSADIWWRSQADANLDTDSDSGT